MNSKCIEAIARNAENGHPAYTIIHQESRQEYQVLGFTRFKSTTGWVDMISYAKLDSDDKTVFTRSRYDFGGFVHSTQSFSSLVKSTHPIDPHTRIKVKMTGRGVEIVASKERAIHSAYPGLNGKKLYPEADHRGWTQWTFWDFISTFGEHMAAGGEFIFTEMRFMR